MFTLVDTQLIQSKHPANTVQLQINKRHYTYFKLLFQTTSYNLHLNRQINCTTNNWNKIKELQIRTPFSKTNVYLSLQNKNIKYKYVPFLLPHPHNIHYHIDHIV